MKDVFGGGGVELRRTSPCAKEKKSDFFSLDLCKMIWVVFFKIHPIGSRLITFLLHMLVRAKSLL